MSSSFPLPADPGAEDEISICIPVPNEPTHIANFLGALGVLASWFSYQRDDAHTGRLAANRWKDIYDYVAMNLGVSEGCEIVGLDDVRQNEETPCILEKRETVGGEWIPFADLTLCPPLIRLGDDGRPQYSTDNGETWQDLPTAPVPPRVPVPGQDDKCLAAANAEEVLYQLYTEFNRLYVEGATAYIIAASIISLLAVIIFYPPALPTVVVFFLELYNLWGSLTGEDYDTEQRDIMRCILFCAASEDEGVYTFDFGEVIAGVGAQWTPVIDYNPFTALEYLLQIIQEDGLNRAGATTSIIEAECDDCTACPEEWCYTWDFTLSDGGWSPRLGDYGVYHPGEGWRQTPGAGLILGIDFSPSVVTHVEYCGQSSDGSGYVWGFYYRLGGVQQHVSIQPGAGIAYCITDLTNTLSDEVWLNPSAGAFSSQLITSCTMRGTGANPFGENNCDDE